jgi:CheY-like chemotaxis protein
MTRILVIDDVETNRFLLEEALEGLADEIHSASDGNRALDLVRELDPEVAVLDFQMPGMNGLETARRVKEREGAPYTWVLLLSGHHDIGEVERFDRSSADRFLAKPYRLDAVREAVREGLRIAAERRAAADQRRR